jgi:hypothetical protein
MQKEILSFIAWRDKHAGFVEFAWTRNELQRLGIPRMLSPREMQIRWRAAHNGESSATAYRIQTLRRQGSADGQASSKPQHARTHPPACSQGRSDPGVPGGSPSRSRFQARVSFMNAT